MTRVLLICGIRYQLALTSWACAPLPTLIDETRAKTAAIKRTSGIRQCPSKESMTLQAKKLASALHAQDRSRYAGH